RENLDIHEHLILNGEDTKDPPNSIISTPPTSSVPSPWELDEDALPPVEERQPPPRSSALLQSPMPSTRSPKKLPLDSPKSRTSIGRRPQVSTRSTPWPIQQRLDPRAARPRARQQATHGKTYQNTLLLVMIFIILLLFAIYLIVYYGPTANIRVGIAT